MTTDLKHYLEYYTTNDSLGYAVLVTGDWGIGKTHQVKRCLDDSLDDKRYIYLSLFGLQSADAVRLSVMTQLVTSKVYPKETSIIKALPALGNVIRNLESHKPLGRLAQGVVESLLSERLGRYVIVFDDLERSSLNIKDLLGVMNHYIEDLRLPVIIISNEQKLEPSFIMFKEKLVGQTIKVVPQVSEAYGAFVSELDTPELKVFLTEQRQLILGLFADSRCTSLRVLRHVLHDVGRIRKLLTKKHLGKPSAITEIVSIFCARDIEFRSGRIDEDDLREATKARYEFMFEQQDGSGTGNKMSRIMQSECNCPGLIPASPHA